MKTDVTTDMLAYRECAKTVWNTYCSPYEILDDFWDKRHLFCDVCVNLFSLMILYPPDLAHMYKKSPSYLAEQTPLECLRIVPAKAQTQMQIARENANEYWDNPATNMVSENDMELAFVDFFDFNVMGEIAFEYYLTHIVSSAKHPELVGRRALLNVDDCRVEMIVEDKNENEENDEK